MKKTHIIFMIGAISLMMASCGKDVEESRSVKSYDTFYITPPALTSDSKAYLEFTQQASRILYEDLDDIYINGVKFTLEKSGDMWVARRSDGSTENLVSDQFDICYADGEVSGYSASNHTYNVNMNSNYSTTSGIVLAGNTGSNEATLTPCFAVLVFKPETMSNYSGVKVGFSANGDPRNFTVSTVGNDGPYISDVSSYAPGITSNSQPAAGFLTMEKVNNDYFYIAVPIVGSSKSMKLYMEYTLAGGSTVKHVTKGFVTLEKGKVYMLPDETRNGYAFDSDGAGVGVFSVSSTQQVKFSAGNLQCIPHYSYRAWRFAEHQYDISNANGQISYNCQNWIDLFGYGTSGTQVGSTYYAFNPFATSGTFYSGNLAGTNADWGVANSSSITYGNALTHRLWRTLTSEEWTYLLGRSGKKGGAGIIYNGDDTINGLVLLPDNWSNPDGLSDFNASPDFESNTYFLEQWDKMEKAGAIFLPAAGSRTGTSVDGNIGTSGFYWTATNGKYVSISIYNSLVLSTQSPEDLSKGYSVRLVSNVLQ